eukprot:758053-Hanusia_phi.AAC.1
MGNLLASSILRLGEIGLSERGCTHPFMSASSSRYSKTRQPPLFLQLTFGPTSQQCIPSLKKLGRKGERGYWRGLSDNTVTFGGLQWGGVGGQRSKEQNYGVVKSGVGIPRRPRVGSKEGQGPFSVGRVGAKQWIGWGVLRANGVGGVPLLEGGAQWGDLWMGGWVV